MGDKFCFKKEQLDKTNKEIQILEKDEEKAEEKMNKQASILAQTESLFRTIFSKFTNSKLNINTENYYEDEDEDDFDDGTSEKFTLKLDKDFNSIGDTDAFKQAAVSPIADALGIAKKRVRIKKISPGSTKVEVEIIPGEGASVSEIIKQVKKQADEVSSNLNNLSIGTTISIETNDTTVKREEPVTSSLTNDTIVKREEPATSSLTNDTIVKREEPVTSSLTNNAAVTREEPVTSVDSGQIVAKKPKRTPIEGATFEPKSQKIKIKFQTGPTKYEAGKHIFIEFHNGSKNNIIGKKEELFSSIGISDNKEKEFTLPNVEPTSIIFVKLSEEGGTDGVHLKKLTITYNNKDYVYSIVDNNKDANSIGTDNKVGWMKNDGKTVNTRWFTNINNIYKNPCPPTQPYLRKWSTSNSYWCYEGKNVDSNPCKMSNSGIAPPADGIWGANQVDCVYSYQIEKDTTWEES